MSPRQSLLEALLRGATPRQASELAAALEVSQPTVSRAIAQLGERVVRIGRGRATRYALRREVGRAGDHWPLYRIGADARPQLLGQLSTLHGDAFHLEGEHPLPALLHGEFSNGWFPGLPWFLDDQRPQGFLGRAFARTFGTELDAPVDLVRWRSDDVLLALLRFGGDGPGDLVLGRQALQQALAGIADPSRAIALDERFTRYPMLAEAALQGEAVGSSAAGEQPKFVTTLRTADAWRAVIVKFSERIDVPGGRRWADLLICEHLAGEVLRDHGVPAARSEVIESGGRAFLESERFDRTPALGRRGFVSMAALDAAFLGVARMDWWQLAPQLQQAGWIDADDAARLARLGLFGALIGNSDMHLGNVGLQLRDERPLALAPAYDMLPMMFRPMSGGEIVAREFRPPPPLPEQQPYWIDAAKMAVEFWERSAGDARISADFRAICSDAQTAVKRLQFRFG